MSADILIIDDESDIRTLISDILEDEGYHTRQGGSAEEAMSQLTLRVPSLVLLDVWLGYVDGLELLKDLKAAHPALPVIVMSGHGTFEMAVKAIKQGAADFIEKPFQVDRLLLSLARTLEASALRRENNRLKNHMAQDGILWGQSSSMAAVKGAITKVGPTNSRVLLIGPSGSGKEILARAIHEQSPRASSPFVTIPCATLVPESFEDVLFGREEEGRVLQVGLLEQAHGGTLFLDAVQEIPLITQGKMVRILQEHEFKRMDGLSSVSVDVRIIASTSIDLKQAIQENLFREDLYYRLNVIPIEVPSLRSRHEDIRGLLNHFLDIMCASLGISKRTWSEDAMAALEAYSWPGNVRELKNVIERALLSASGKSAQLGLDVLPLEVQGIVPMIVNQERTEEILSLPLKKARDFFERQYLLAQVERFGGNISRTAEFVGMERSALHRKLRALQVDSLRKQAVEG